MNLFMCQTSDFILELRNGKVRVTRGNLLVTLESEALWLIVCSVSCLFVPLGKSLLLLVLLSAKGAPLCPLQRLSVRILVKFYICLSSAHRPLFTLFI
jgi:hypothetical protein